jgi:hypothetical protein
MSDGNGSVATRLSGVSGRSSELGADLFHKSQDQQSGDTPRRSARTQDTPDWRDDHKLNKRQMSAGAVQKFLEMLGQSSLTQGYQIKILSSIVIFRTEVDSGLVMQTTAKERTGEYHLYVNALPQAERRGHTPPFVLVMVVAIEVGAQIARSKYPEDSSTVAAFTNYEQYLAQFEEGKDRLNAILEDWRYARFRTTHQASRAILELGVSPICSAVARPLLKAIMKVTIDTMNGRKLEGVAPKTKVELRLEAALKQMGAWR